MPIRRGAFTLAEVLVAIAVLALVSLAITSVLIYSFHGTSKAGDRHAASLAASSLLDEIEVALRSDFDQVTSCPRQDVPQALTQGGPAMEYTVVEEVEDAEATLKRVEVTVFWRDRHGDQSYRLWTRFVRP